MSNALKIVLLSIAFIIVCLVSIVGIKISNEGKTMTTSGTQQIKAAVAGQGEMEVTAYDGNALSGNDLKILIAKTVEEEAYLSIVVRTLSGSRTDYNYVYNDNNTLGARGTLAALSDKSLGSNINPGGEFMGEVMRDTNNTCICIWYEQTN